MHYLLQIVVSNCQLRNDSLAGFQTAVPSDVLLNRKLMTKMLFKYYLFYCALYMGLNNVIHKHHMHYNIIDTPNINRLIYSLRRLLLISSLTHTQVIVVRICVFWYNLMLHCVIYYSSTSGKFQSVVKLLTPCILCEVRSGPDCSEYGPFFCPKVSLLPSQPFTCFLLRWCGVSTSGWDDFQGRSLEPPPLSKQS